MDKFLISKRKREDEALGASSLTPASNSAAVAEASANASTATVEAAAAGAGSADKSEELAILASLGISASDPSIGELFLGEASKSYFKKLIESVRVARASSRVVFPPAGRELAAVTLISGGLSKVKVLILGQDPYHGAGQAHGLSFSVPQGILIPPSLRNILKEAGISSSHGNLEAWAKQGVLLLNTVLTVYSGAANSHSGLGWETLTDAIVRCVSIIAPHCVFLLWGKPAQEKKRLIQNSLRHLILEAPHPSPLSAHRGFFGSGHFSKTNEFLVGHGLAPINWKL
jgi:uracil-DNA glycosylase